MGRPGWRADLAGEADPLDRTGRLGPGTQAGGEKSEEFAAFVRAEILKWGKVIKDAGIKIE